MKKLGAGLVAGLAVSGLFLSIGLILAVENSSQEKQILKKIVSTVRILR